MKSKKYMIEVILFLTYMLFAMSWKAGDILVAKLGFSATESAIMTNAINIAKILGSLSAAMFIAKLGNRKVFTVSTLLITMGILIPFVNGFSTIFLIRFILGFGGALVLVTINPIVAKIFEGDELPVVNGLNSVAFNVGIAMSLTLSKGISANPTLAIKIISGILLIGVVMWLPLSKELEENKLTNIAKAEIENYNIWDGFKESFNWVFSLSYSGILGFYLVSFTFMKAENVKYVIYAGVIGALLGTFQAKKFKDKLKLVRISSLLQVISGILFVVYYNDPIVKVIGVALGFFIFFPMPAYVTLAFSRPNSTPRKISVTFSIFWAVSYSVSIILIQIFAFLKDTMGDNIALTFILASLASMFIGTMLFMKNQKEEI